MKEAIRGTQHSEEEGREEAILQQAGIDYLQKLAGYIPASIAADCPMYPPVNEQDAAYVDAMMSRLCGEEVTKANPRVPYFMTIWLLIGSDNPFQVYNLSNQKDLIMSIAKLLLRIACGDNPSQIERQSLIRQATMVKIATISPSAWKARSRLTGQEGDTERMIEAYHDDVLATATLRAVGVMSSYTAKEAWLAWVIGDIVHELRQIGGHTVTQYTQEQARAWCYVDDADAGRIARHLLFDMLLRGKVG